MNTSMVANSSGDLYKTLQKNMQTLNQEYANATKSLNSAGLADDLYKKTGGTTVDAALQDKTRDYHKSYRENVEKYAEMGITNPEYQNALANQKKGIAGTQVQGLQDEQTRRAEVINNYVSLWADTYGAKAKAAQSGSGNTKTSFIQNARQTIESSLMAQDASGNFVQTKDGTVDPQVYQQLRRDAIDYGMSASVFDGYFKDYLSSEDAASLNISGAKGTEEFEMDQSESWNFLNEEVKNNPDITEDELVELAKVNNIDVSPTSVFSKSWQSNLIGYDKYASQAKNSRKEAKDGEYYLDEDGNVYQKNEWWGSDKLIISKRK